MKRMVENEDIVNKGLLMDYPFYYDGISPEELEIERSYYFAYIATCENRGTYHPIWYQTGQKMKEISFYFEGMQPIDFVDIVDSFHKLPPEEIFDIQVGKHHLLPLEKRTRKNVFEYFGVDQDA